MVGQNKIRLRRATDADVDAYIDIDKKVSGRTYAAITTPEEVLEEMRKGPVYVIEKDATTVGFVSYEKKEDGSIYLSMLTVDPAFQGQRIGRAALEQILEEVKDSPTVWLLTHPENERAIRLYESFGFIITGRKENYFGDGEPRIVLTKKKTTLQ